MKAKLWKVHFQHPKYFADHEDVTVNAPNARCAIDRACKITYMTPKKDRRKMIEFDIWPKLDVCTNETKFLIMTKKELKSR